MDIFSYKNPNAPILMESGQIINGITSKMWVERYAEAGEFTLVAPVDSGLKEKLPIGSFISHMDTAEIMIVENHEITDAEDQESTITVTGRGLETYFEQRIVGSNRVFPRTNVDLKFTLPAIHTWGQIVYLINYHIDAASLIDPENELPFMIVETDVTGSGVEAQRKIDQRDIYTVVQELLKIDNLGIKVYRPGVAWSPHPGAESTTIVIHKGVNRTAEVIFSYDSGEIVNADYLWSNKDLKTSALVSSKWIQTMVSLPGATRYLRRMMHVDASDIDETLDQTTAAGFIGAFSILLEERGLDALKSQKEVVLTKAEVSKRAVNSRYRVDFNVGDLISVVGDYNESSVMRVSEFVEIEDDNGSVAYPTLSLETQDS